MSAFLCDPTCLADLARGYVQHVALNANAGEVYAELLTTNLASLAARYGETAGTLAENVGDVTAYDWPVPELACEIAQPASYLDEHARSYAYQSCEHDGWRTSDARGWIDALRAAFPEIAP